MASSNLRNEGNVSPTLRTLYPSFWFLCLAIPCSQITPDRKWDLEVSKCLKLPSPGRGRTAGRPRQSRQDQNESFAGFEVVLGVETEVGRQR